MANVFKKVRKGKKSEYFSCRYYDRVTGRYVEKYFKGCRDKGVALTLAKRCELDAAKEDAGELRPRSIRGAEAVELSRHLREYLDDLKAKGRVRLYLRNRETYITTVCRECKWRFPQDINPSDFIAWRGRQRNKAPKTLNDYLFSCVNFLRWMVKLGRLAANPLADIEKADIKGTEVRFRRALTVDECCRLLAAVSPVHCIIYSLALYCGLRRSEIQGLRWVDVTLGEHDSICVPASLAKNRKTECLPVHPAFAVKLKEHRAAHPDAVAVVGKVPRMDVVRQDWAAAGIPYVDAAGRVADFHSLRKTFVTQLQAHGVSTRSTQAMARHSDPMLTAKTYMSEYMLPLFDDVSRLPSYYPALGARKGALFPASTGQILAGGGTIETKNSQAELLPLDCIKHVLAQPGTRNVMVGDTELESVTSCVSSKRSNQLS